MWTKVELNQTPQKFQDHINEYLERNNHAELLKVMEINDCNIVDSYSAYIFHGNLCVIITMWTSGALDGHIKENYMTIGEIKEFIKCEKVKWWFE